MNSGDFDFLCEFLKKQSGLVLTADKVYLVESRLLPVAKRRGLNGLADLVSAVRSGRDRELIQDVTEAMTTNESFFFRDKTPFENLRAEVLPKLIESRNGSKRLRIWSAAASTGQEPYTIAMVLKEMSVQLSGWRVDVIGTDISSEVLEKARAGMYSQFEVQRGLPIQLLVKHFKQIGEMWQIDSSIRAMVEYRTGNLLENFKHLGTFDIVFCRNVLIYFDQQTKKEVLERIADLLPDDGVLFLGAAETVLGVTDKLTAVNGLRGVYRKTVSAAETNLPDTGQTSAVRLQGAHTA